MVNGNLAVGDGQFDSPTILLPWATSSNYPFCPLVTGPGDSVDGKFWVTVCVCVCVKLSMVGFCVFAGKWGDFGSDCGLPYVEGFVQDC